MSKFTSGPWRIMPIQRQNEDEFLFLSGESINVITCGRIGKHATEGDIANAKLISKAPEMYELLLKAARTLRTYLGNDVADEISKLLKEIDDENH